MKSRKKIDKVSYFDTVIMGALEEEISYEFYFDVEQFRKYLKNKEKDNLIHQQNRNSL